MKAYVSTTKQYLAYGYITIPDEIREDEERIYQYINNHENEIDWDENESPDGHDGIYLEELVD